MKKRVLSPALEERRVRRAARREAQRQANIGRSAKMHEARIKSAPPSCAKTRAKLERYHVGCSGWFYWHWRGDFYPQEMQTNQWFGHYSDHFKTVELNAPFYSWPTVAAVKAWVRQAGEKNFIYTLKVCELVTHVKRFVRTKTLIRDFGYIADLLGERMGCFLFQMPPSYHFTPARLKSIVTQLDPAHRNVVEFRHRSWWNAKVYKAFTTAGIIFCSCSGPRLPDELVKTGKEVYVRFHGVTRWYRHDYTPAELQVWADRIVSSGAERAWIYFNNDRDGYAIKNARQLLKLLRVSSERRTPVPAIMK